MALVLAVLLFPVDAHAWGPLTHLAHGSQALADLTIAGAALQEILRKYRIEYLYGCIGADITQAKKYTRRMQYHCHSWIVGWQLVEAAETDAQRAFAYGYLSHLSSDVYSHNHFVPTQLVVSYEASALRHVYWEARFDSMQDTEYRYLLRELVAGSFPDCDALVKDVVARTLFSFSTNKVIFNSMMAWQQFEQWHSMMLKVSSRSRFHLPNEVVPAYNRACVAGIHDLFKRGKKSFLQREDPTGTDAMVRAKDLRAKLKLLARKRLITPEMKANVHSLSLAETAILLPRPA
jgi:hypothetical protein